MSFSIEKVIRQRKDKKALKKRQNMDVEQIQKINQLALDLLRQGLATDREDAVRQAERIFKGQGAEGIGIARMAHLFRLSFRIHTFDTGHISGSRQIPNHRVQHKLNANISQSWTAQNRINFAF